MFADPEAGRRPVSHPTHKSLAAMAPAMLLGLNLLVFGTYAVFSQNRGEFVIGYPDALLHYYLPLLAVFAAIALLYLIPAKRLREGINASVILLAVLTYIHGNLLLWDTGVLDGSQLNLSRIGRSLVDAALWCGLGWAAYRYRKWLLIHGWKICLTLILFQAIGALAAHIHAHNKASQNPLAFPPELARFSSKTNVIHIVLDGFQASLFEELVNEHPDFTHSFSGFTFFRDALTASDITYLSVPSTLSGKAFKNQQTISAYQEQTLGGKNLYSFLAANHFKVDVATPLWWNKPKPLFSSYYRIPTPYADAQESLLSATLLLGDISLFRQAPHFLKSLIYRSGRWLLSSQLVANPEQQFQHFAHNAFLQDLKRRMSIGPVTPVYKFIHLVTPHPPFVAGSDCKFTSTVLAYSKKAFKQQSYCTLNNVVTFLDQLKSNGIYKGAMIIIHGDHGGGVPFEMFLPNGEKTTSAQSLHRMWGNPLPLILIKPPGAGGELQISNRQVQLLDIPATVAEQLGLPNEFPGQSMFEAGDQAVRDRYFYDSTIHRNEAAAKDHFDQFTSYRIAGSVYQLASWHEVESYTAPATDNASNYRWGTRINFGRSGNSHPFQDGGWIVTRSEDVTWTRGTRAGLAISFPAASCPLMLHAVVKPLLAPGKLERQRVGIYVGSEKVGDWFVRGNKFHEVTLPIPQNLLSAAGKTEISFELPDAQSPKSLGTGKDARALALAFMTIEFEEVGCDDTK